MRLIVKKLCEHLQRIAEIPAPAPEPFPKITPPVQLPELWSITKDFLTLYPAGSKAHERIVGVFLNRIRQNPALIARLHPASSQFHRDLINEVLKHPDMNEELRSKMFNSPEITAALL